jgi:GNAT superfamily N-acetyltransferase
MKVQLAETDAQIAATYDVMKQLRPHISREEYLPQVRSRILYVDDLVTDDRVRSKGYGRELLNWLRKEGQRFGCNDLQLISRVTREQAHRFYFREGMSIMCFHFRSELP